MAESPVIRITNELDHSPFHITPTPPPVQNTVVIDRTLSCAANLVKLLPSGTVLAFKVLSPSFTNKGVCYTSNKYLTSVMIHLCALSCFFFSFTDTLVGRDGRHYYGIATLRGFYVFNYDGPDENRAKVFTDLDKFRMRILDYVHAFFSVLVFLVITFSDADIQNCFFPSAGRNTKQLLVNLPPGIGFLVSIVFVIFPTSRKNIGYSDAAPRAQ